MELNKVYLGDALESIKTFPDNSIDCVVTSPPYYALRDYGTGEWIGGDPNCKHYRTSKASDKTITGHKRMQEAGAPVGDAIYKSVCPICGAVRVDRQIGLEDTPEAYIQRLVDLFHEIKRVLKDSGTLWVNIGDSYWGGDGEMLNLTSIAAIFRKEVSGLTAERICPPSKVGTTTSRAKTLSGFLGCSPSHFDPMDGTYGRTSFGISLTPCPNQ